MRAALQSRVLPFAGPARPAHSRWRTVLRDFEVASIAVVAGMTLALLIILWRMWQLTSLALAHFLGMF